MTRNVEFYETLPSVESQALIAFCAACAERGGSIFLLLNSTGAREWLQGTLELGWRAAVGDHVEDEAVAVIEDFESQVNGDEEDDPHSPDFYATQAAALAVNTLSVYLNPSPQQAEMSGHIMETLLSDFDLALSDEKSRVVRTGTRSPAGRIQQLEQEAQTSSLQAVEVKADGQLPRARTEELRSASCDFRDELAGSVAAVAQQRNWDVNL